MKCQDCVQELTGDEIGLSIKLGGRQSKVRRCLVCQAAYYRVEVSQLKELIEQYRADGCVLFEPIMPEMSG